MKLQFVGGEVLNGLRRNVSMALSVVIVTMVSIFLLGLGLLAQTQASMMKGYWYDRIQVSIYLCNPISPSPNCQGQAVTDAQKAAIETQLKAMPEVKEVFFETEAEALQRFREQFPNNAGQSLQEGDLPSSFRVQLNDPTKYAVVSTQFEGMPGVASVQDQERVLKRFFSIINWVTLFAVALASLMAACAALLMATTIRQAAFIRRREIGIMRLVGASNWTIRMPFLLEMLFVALLGGFIAVLLLWWLVDTVVTRELTELAQRQAFIGTEQVWAVAPWMLLGIVAIAVLTSLFTLRRYLRV